ncbi:cytochrome P450 [Halobacillus sp. BBL2006]|uniref:cytochrome P450 n=1 Tax=Halobacillus sp. BBL2006 TaxID=1543706 RepID=UPI00054276D6|nr:cytochrome P450 [Halobacillus sp. BBL2006]KHE69502.1 cytochrome P450 [Halobacillus sp. BBL2006]
MAEQRSIPKDKGTDHTLKLLQEGYTFILNRSHRFHTNIFETKLLGEEVYCLVGKDAAEIFYDNDKFRRKDAAPPRAQKTLFGEGGVQGLDGGAHLNRKKMFMNLMTKDSLQEVRSLTGKAWKLAALEWNLDEPVSVYDEARKVMTRVASAWTGVPIADEHIEEWAGVLGDMYESPTAIGPKHWKGRRARSKAEARLEDLIEKVREEKIDTSKDRALYHFSWHRDESGELLDKHTVAVELLNLLRPMVAISVYIDFLVLAIHEHPEKVDKLRTSDEDQLQYFIQEVRRYYPFFPFAAARVDQDFTWNGYEFKEGTLTLLDLYGTNHHPELWENPKLFQPERFQTWDGHPFDFIPHGGGEFEMGHRCAGEWLTIEVLKETLDHFVNRMSFEFPEQNRGFSLKKIPSVPKSKIQLTGIGK